MKRPEQVWLLWLQAKAVRTRPSKFLNIRNTYVAYCLDQAVIFFGMQFEGMLQDAGHKPSKEERRAQAAREALVKNMFSPDAQKGTGFADPALMFK